ncbi:MAG TPA: acyl-CoA synthetase [Sporichthyaceae bacterium]|jgi:fatty-acyl-CoA synthase|nr:acyl-CoA synthetase [Sporichthyaceae bacterium]
MFPGTHAALTPDKPAVIMAESGETLTYGQLDERSLRLARALAAAGLRRGDVVAMIAENSPVALEIYWAALRSGLYLTAINHHLSVEEVTYVVADCGARAVVASAAKAQLAAVVAAEVTGPQLWLSFGGAVAGYDDYEQALQSAGTQPPASQPRGAAMLYSSGTTGHPKGIKPPLPDSEVDDPDDRSAGLLSSLYGFGPDTVYLSPAPIYHTAPLRFCGVVNSTGGTVVMMSRFDPVGALEAIQKYEVTHAQFVPTMFVRMLKLPAEQRTGYDLSTLRTVIHAAAPCPVAVKEAMLDWWGDIIHEYYGATEANGLTFIDPAQWRAHPGSVGRAGLGVIRICADDGVELPPGADGTVYFERDEVPFIYHNDPDSTAAAQHPAQPNWTTTGDIGHVDSDGFLYLTDRKAFMIISGGVNIYPQEIEDCLALHPAVLDVAVIGIPDAEMGESVKAVVQPASGATPGPDLERELIEFVRMRIAHFKAPRSVDFDDELPRTPAGKLLKRCLKERYLTP